MIWWNPMYLLFALPAMLLAFYAQWRVKSTYRRYLKEPNGRGVSGVDAADHILRSKGMGHISIDGVQGELTDHYDPRSKTLRLSQGVARGRSIASLSIVAHEIGHALQDAEGYMPLRLRSAMVPAVSVSSWVGPILFLLGWFLQSTGLAWAGVLLFAAGAVFALVTLPVEFNASQRGLQLLESYQLVDGREMVGARKVLNAAALTYIAALAQTLSTLLYYVFMLTGFGRRD
jgi:Zn-dependent membrane protease YugP